MIRYLHGFHAGCLHDGYGSTGAQNMEDRPGWIVFTETAGIDGGDYTLYRDWGFGVLVRLNHGYFPDGTIPERTSYPDFAATCAQHVKNSHGVDVWTIGNEPNHSTERPHSIPIYASDYAECFRMCRDAIRHETPGAQVAVAAVAPYNNETGDFGDYQVNVLTLLGPGGYDGVCIHAYTHGADPALITSPDHMNPPFENYHYHFRVYRDLAQRVPAGVPLYLTETDQNDPWLDTNSGWVREMYREVWQWNLDHPEHTFRCACLYRYPPFDRWAIVGRNNVIEDFREAVDIGYTWTDTDHEPEPEPDPEPPEEENMITIATEAFDGPFTVRNDPYTGETNVGELKVQAGWTPYWVWGPAQSPPAGQGELIRPEYYPSGGVSGQCQAVHVSSATMDTCIWRRFVVTPGATLLATVRGMIDSKVGAQHGVVMGIDPLAGTDMLAASVVWGDWLGQGETDQTWQGITTSTVAQATQATVFLRSKNDYRIDAAAHWEQFTLEADIGEPEPEPDPDPEPGPETEEVTIELLINGAAVFSQTYRPRVTSMVLEPVGGFLAQLIRTLTH